MMIRVLWVAPVLNFYKAAFLERLTSRGTLDIVVLSGETNRAEGHLNPRDTAFRRISVAADKEHFGIRVESYIRLFTLLRNESFDWVLMPIERKYILLILFLFLLKPWRGFKLVSYNHSLTPRVPALTLLQRLFPRLAFLIYDRVVFYTEGSMRLALRHGLISTDKASFANNTLDTASVWSNYTFNINSSDRIRLLFIGRLLPYRNLDLLFDYHNQLKKSLPGLQLVIIGDGPETAKIAAASNSDSSIVWKGGLSDEREIAREMEIAHAVIVPGHSGLSIVHAFAYGKPYITLGSYPNHPPEIDYLIHGVNGLLLTGDIAADCKMISQFLLDRKGYRRACEAAYNTAKTLAVENWCTQIEEAMTS